MTHSFPTRRSSDLILVGLVGEVEDAGAVGDAVFELPHAHDVLLVVGAGGDDLRGRPAEHLLDGGGNGPHHRRFRVGHGRLAGQHLAQRIGERWEERRGGKEWHSTCRSRWSTYQLKKKN